MSIVTKGPMLSPAIDIGDARVPFAESIGAAGHDAFEDSATQQLIGIHELTRAKGDTDVAAPVADPMGAPIPSYEEEPQQKPGAERIDMLDALHQVKQAGLDKTLKLPNEPDIAPAALQIMIDRARTRAEHAATIARGPQGIVPDAMMLGTSFLVGAVDPLNIASAFVPVIGELRYGKLLAAAGETAAARAGVRAGVGAAQGVTGQALLEPIDWYAHSQDGRDFGMSDVLHNLIFGGLLGAGLHSGGGALSDAWRAHKGRPLYPFGPGEPLDRSASAATPAEAAAAIRPDMDAVDRVLAGQSPTVPDQYVIRDFLGAASDEETMTVKVMYDGNGQIEALETPRQIVKVAPAYQALSPEEAIAATLGSHPDGTAPDLSKVTSAAHERPQARPLREVAPQFAVLDDLPPRAQEDAARASIAALLDGTPVRSAELLDAAAQTDPRIAESFALAKPPETLTPQAARQAVADDIRQKLLDAGLPPEQADANAALTAARYHARADRLGTGQSALDLYRGEGIAVRGAEGAALASPEEAARMLNQRGEPDLFAAREAEGQQSLPGTERIGQGELAQRGADAPLKPGVAQKPADQGLFGDSAAQKSFFQSAPQAPPFYSAVDRAIGAAKQDKATPEQWLGTLTNSAGVKPEEMKWLGLEDWLKQQDGSVSKQQLQDYVRANAIEVKEVAKGAVIDKHPALKAVENENARVIERFGGLQEGWEQMTPQEYERHNAIHSDASEVRDAKAEELYERPFHMLREFEQAAVDNELNGGATDTKYPSYTLPGGENYRELLLTLPEKQQFDSSQVRIERVPLSATQANVRLFYGDRKIGTFADNQHPDEYWIDLMRRRAAGDRSLGVGPLDEGANFRSSHWEEPNVLAHIRFDDRISDGKKTLHLAEVQSDWHQKGKREGYKNQTKPLTPEEHQELVRLRAMGSSVQRNAADYDRYSELQERAAAHFHAVPDAPFKTTWPELSMKRMIRYAAEHGYDRLSWDTGATNAERYDLSKQIKEIEYVKNADGSYKLGIADKEGEPVGALPGMDVNKMTLDQVERALGKEVAEKIKNEEGKKFRGHDGFTLENVDLKVGGQGMAGFYDRILPATVNRLVKKFGARVEEGTVGAAQDVHTSHFVGNEPTRAQMAQVAEAVHARPTDQRFVSPVTGERQAYQINRANNEMAMRAVRQAMSEGASFADAMGQHATHDLAEVFGGKIEVRNKTDQKSEPVHSLDLTPELRAAAMEHGFPLFQGGAESPRGRITLANNRAIIDLYKSADASTFLHESGHLWLDELMRDAAGSDAPAGLRADRDTVLGWLGVKHAGEIGTAQHEQWAEGFEHYLKTGEAPSGALTKAFAQFKAWLTEIYRALAGSGQEVSPEIRQVMDRLLATEAEIADRADELGASTRAITPSGPRGRAASDPQTWSLFEYLASKGGLKPDPELAALFGPGRGPFLGGFGPLLRKDGMALDEALRVAKEGHYLFDAGDVSGAEAHLTPRDLLDTLDREGRGTKVYRNDHVPERAVIPEEEARHIVDALHRELEPDAGKAVEIDPRLEARVVQIVQREGEHDVLAAYERAIMEDAERYDGLAEARQQDESTRHIEGWDVAEPAATPRAGAPDPGRSGPAGLSAAGPGGTDGGGPRATGGGDRAPGAAQSGPAQLAAGLRPQGPADPQAWHALARAVPEYDAPDAVRASEQAAAAPEPVAVNAPPSERLKAALAAEARSAELFEAKAAFLAPEERVRVDDLLRSINLEEADRREIFARGAVCLAEAAGLVA